MNNEFKKGGAVTKLTDEDFIARFEVVEYALNNSVGLDEPRLKFGLKRRDASNFAFRICPVLITNMEGSRFQDFLSWINAIDINITKQCLKKEIKINVPHYFPELTNNEYSLLFTAIRNIHKYNWIIGDSDRLLNVWQLLKKRRDNPLDVTRYGERPMEKRRVEKQINFFELKTTPQDGEIKQEETAKSESIQPEEPKSEEVKEEKQEAKVYIKIESQLLNFDIEKSFTSESLNKFIKKLLEGF